jgi:hypothetical protein
MTDEKCKQNLARKPEGEFSMVDFSMNANLKKNGYQNY